MRHPILSRAAVAVASLAVGSAALVAAPANAAAPAGITRDHVLSIASSVRAANAAETDYPYKTTKALNKLIARACSVDFDGENHLDGTYVQPVVAGNVDGFVASTYVHSYDDNGEGIYRLCSFGALATTDGSFSLRGPSSLTVTPTAGSVLAPSSSVSPALSGNVAITGPINVPGDSTYRLTADFTASGNATKTTTTTVVKKVKDKKSKAQKKAAKKKYSKRLTQAEKNYQKALDKADGSKNKKAAAKRVYAKARALAKARYKYAIANYKNVKKKSSSTENRPFAVSATVDANFD